MEWRLEWREIVRLSAGVGGVRHRHNGVHVVLTPCVRAGGPGWLSGGLSLVRLYVQVLVGEVSTSATLAGHWHPAMVWSRRLTCIAGMCVPLLVRPGDLLSITGVVADVCACQVERLKQAQERAAKGRADEARCAPTPRSQDLRVEWREPWGVPARRAGYPMFAMIFSEVPRALL